MEEATKRISYGAFHLLDFIHKKILLTAMTDVSVADYGK